MPSSEIAAIDVVLVSGRRPTLLEPTLASFQDNLLQFFNVENVFVNIDPFMGTDADGSRCAEIVKSYFPKALIRQPEAPSFTAAVKWLLAAATDTSFFTLGG